MSGSALAGTLVLAATITTAELRAEFPIPPRLQPLVDDAILRWSKKNHSDKTVIGPAELADAMEERIPIIVTMKDRRCVFLMLRATSVGGSPVYCYDIGSDALVEKNDDVE